MIYTVTLNPALDYVLKVDKLGFEDINRARESRILFGGKGINVSVVLSRLKTPNIALGFAGGFSGEKLEELLRLEGVQTDFVKTKGETRINVKIRCGEELDINAKGAEISDCELKAFFEKIEKAKAGDFVILSGSPPANFQDDIYEAIIKKLIENGADFAVDAEGNLLLNCLKYKPFLIKPNHHELSDIFSENIKTAQQAKPFALKLQEMGARNVLVSLAENGALLLDENGCFHIAENAEGKLVNSVGCGDSMVAGFISGYLETGDYSKALKLASACANASAYSEELATLSEIENLLKNNGSLL